MKCLGWWRVYISLFLPSVCPQVDLFHMWQERLGVAEQDIIDLAIDLADFHRSVEWDLLTAVARKNIIKYPCCIEKYPDITFNLTLRRKTLFYTINLLIPCISINALTILGFYLPSDAGEKVCVTLVLRRRRDWLTTERRFVSLLSCEDGEIG